MQPLNRADRRGDARKSLPRSAGMLFLAFLILIIAAPITIRSFAQEQSTDGLTPPEIVHLEKAEVHGNIREVTASSSENLYHLACAVGKDACITPTTGKDYWVISKTTKWKAPGAEKCCLTLSFLEGFSGEYKNHTNIALFPADASGGSFGIYIVLSVVPASPKTAQDYFDELKSTNTLDRYQDEYVCFDDDDPEPSFAIVARARDVIRMMKKAGNPSQARKLEQSSIKDGLFVQGYYKGVPAAMQVYDGTGADGTDFMIAFDSPFKGKMTYSINWATDRYHRTVYDFSASKTMPSLEFFGKCQLIHPDVDVPKQ